MSPKDRTGALALAWLTLSFIACAGNGADADRRNAAAAEQPVYPRFDGAAAYRLVDRQLAFGPRVPGTEGHRAMATWLETFLGERANTLIVQRFEHSTVEDDTIGLFNFLARFQPEKGRPILLLAHWDTRPFSDQADEDADRDRPVPGANDGASGTAILLQLAEMMAVEPPPQAVDLLLVDGEDYGDFGVGKDVFLGSRHFAANLPPDYDPRFGVLLDMVGDRDLAIYVESNSNRLAPEVVDRVWTLAGRIGFGDVFHRSVRHTVNDDHIPLNEAGIPTINVIDFDYPYWHTPDDTLDKVAASSLEAVGTVMSRLVYSGGGRR